MKDINSLNNNFPWLVYSLNNSYFALNCENITTITILPKRIIQPVLAPPYIRGLLDLRGDVIPLVDMRMLFEFPTKKAEYDEVMDILSKRMEDHKNWVAELERCVVENDTFKLTLDPHQCAFGKWYDNFKTDSSIINSHLKKINAPHCELHECGAHIVELMKHPQSQEREEKINRYLLKAKDELMPAILSIVKRIENDWIEVQKEMVVVFNYDNKKIGLVVDEVKSVETLEILSSEVNIDMQHIAHFFSCIARSPRTSDIIFLIDESELGLLFSQDEIDTTVADASTEIDSVVGAK